MAKADEEAAIESATRAKERAKDFKEKYEALDKLNRKLKRDINKVSSEPNIMQLAVTGVSVAAGVAGGIAGHRYLRKKTEKWVKKDDPKKRTIGAVMVCEVLPILGGVIVGAGTAMSDNGVVASVGGVGWGEAAGVVIDLVLPKA